MIDIGYDALVLLSCNFRVPKRLSLLGGCLPRDVSKWLPSSTVLIHELMVSLLIPSANVLIGATPVYKSSDK